jgi:hypothetical protein
MRNLQKEKIINGALMKRFGALIVMAIVGVIFTGGVTTLLADSYDILLTPKQRARRKIHQKIYNKVDYRDCRHISVKPIKLLGEETGIVLSGNYPIVCDYNASIANPDLTSVSESSVNTKFPLIDITKFPVIDVTKVPVAVTKIDVVDEDGPSEVNSIPALPTQAKLIKNLLCQFTDDICAPPSATSELVPDLSIDEGKDESLTNAFCAMIEDLDIEAMNSIDRARLIDRLRDFSTLKAEMAATIDSKEALTEEEKAQAQVDLAGKLLESVHTLRLVMDSLKHLAEKDRGGDLKSSRADEFCNSLMEGQGQHSDKYSELASRMVLRYSISKAEPLFKSYQKMAESTIPDRSEDCSKSDLKIKEQLGAMRTYMIATRKLYIDGGKNGRSLGARYTAGNEKSENNINAEVAFSKLSRCFKNCNSIKKEQKKVEKSVTAPLKEQSVKQVPAPTEHQSAQNEVVAINEAPVNSHQSAQLGS